MKKPKSDYSIQTVVNALRLLEAFGDAETLGVTELSRALDLHKNNVFRLLATLEERGYVRQEGDNGRYALDTRCLELARAFDRAGGGLLDRGREVVGDLARDVDETAHLAVLRSFEVVHLCGSQPKGMLVVSSRVGERLPLHCTALGKVLLGCGGEVRWAEYERSLGAGGLERLTRTTIVDRDKLVEHLQGVGVQGYALDVEECVRGLCCAAAPVFDARGELVAALSVSAPQARMPGDDLARSLVPEVVASAERLSAELGFDRPASS